jgi:hypothetical protein
LLTGIFQVYVVGFGTIPFMPLIGETVNVPSLQIVSGAAVIFGLGFTFITAVKSGPVQAPAIGVIV